MKKIGSFLVVLFTFLTISTQAQYNHVAPPDSSKFDLLYVFDTSFFANCFSTSDTLRTRFSTSSHDYVYYPYSRAYSKFDWYNTKNKEWCNPDAPLPQGYVIGANCTEDTSAHYAEAFAQEYHFENGDIPYNDYVVCGVAIKLGINALDVYRHFYILNQNFDTIAYTLFHTTNVVTSTGWREWETTYWNRNGWNTYYFLPEYYDTLTNINDFRIAFDVPMYGSGNNFQVHHTCNVYSPCIRDSINAMGGAMRAGLCYDTIPMGFLLYTDRFYYTIQIDPPEEGEIHYPYYAYQEYMKQFDEDDVIPLCVSGVPKFLQRNGEWINFADDPVYEIWQNIHIAMVPIIMIPQTSQSLSEVELEKMCYVFPNPAKDIFKVMSHYTIKDIQVFDMMGKKVLEKEVNYFETEIIVDNLASGTYIVKINTAKGTTEKKLVVQ
jgi:hypothetical protein